MTEAKVLSPEKRRTRILTPAEVRRAMEPATRNKTAALKFLKEIGVTVCKDGSVKVKPVHV